MYKTFYRTKNLTGTGRTFAVRVYTVVATCRRAYTIGPRLSYTGRKQTLEGHLLPITAIRQYADLLSANAREQFST